MISSIDHIVILVKELAVAVQDYTALGFTVIPGGAHTDAGTHNALVAFADGTYLELIAFQRPDPVHRWWKYTTTGSGEGIIDFALLPDAIAQDIAAIRQRGLSMEGPYPSGRLRPDGQEIKWQIGIPPSPDLPFLCADVTPRPLRVPSGPAWQHPNGVIGIANLRVVVAELATGKQHYQTLLGLEPQLNTATFSVGNATISLTAAVPGTPQAERLHQRGEGPFSLTLRTAHPGHFDPTLTHSTRLELE